MDAADPGILIQPFQPSAATPSARWAARVTFPDVNADRFGLVVRESEMFPDGRLLFLETLEIP